MSLNELQQYSSPYLQSGYKEDEYTVRSIEINDEFDTFIATIDITDYYLPSDGQFHLSALTCSRVMQQLLIIFTFKYLQRPKDAEIFVLSEKCKFRKLVTDTKNIPFKVDAVQVTEKRGKLFFNAAFDVGEGAFLGEACWCLPINGN